MRNALLFAALALTGCGAGETVELYSLVISHFSLPDSCYSSNQQPDTTVTVAPPSLMNVKVWGGPDGAAFLEVESGSVNVDMGAAPNVAIAGILNGKSGEKGWTFATDTVESQKVFGNNTLTVTTHAEVTFPRGTGAGKGTAALSSSQVCTGGGCPGNNPSCSVSGIAVESARIASDFERAP